MLYFVLFFEQMILTDMLRSIPPSAINSVNHNCLLCSHISYDTICESNKIIIIILSLLASANVTTTTTTTMYNYSTMYKYIHNSMLLVF